MPSSTRKSSIGTARRGIQKAHIPYRGDNPEIGKKTGIAVQHVQRKSDGFEPFEELIQQADKRTPPKPKKRKKSMPFIQQPDFNDEDGEMSMDLDDSPIRYNAQARTLSTPTLKATSSSTRAIYQTPEIDFEEIPSPRPRASLTRSAKAGSSSLSKTVISSSRNLPSGDELDYDDDVNGPAMTNGNYDFIQPDYDPPQYSSPRRQSFSQIDRDGDDDQQIQVDEEEADNEFEEEPPQNISRVDKGKRKMVLEDIQEEEEVENDIGQDMSEARDDLGEEELPSPPPKKKQKVTQDKNEKPKRTSSRSKKENKEPREGIRRSQREHYKPLDWWRGEKVVYGRTNSSGPVYVPTIKEIRRIPIDLPQPLTKKKRGSTRARSKSKTIEERLVPVFNPEEGWDDSTEPIGEVFDVDKQSNVNRRVAYTAKRIKLKQAANNEWSFEKVFGDGDFMAGGMLEIPPDSRKPTKATKDNTYIFYVIQGAVNFKVAEVSKVIATGGMFIAPRGNTYFIENISNREARLFFAQARKVPKEEMALSSSPVKSRRKSNDVVKSSSPARASSKERVGRTAQSLPPKSQNQAAPRARAPSAKI